MASVLERVDSLEDILKRYISNTEIWRAELQASRLQTEAEIRDLKREMSAFQDEVRRENREMNRKWGDMANKLGTIVEDLVAPSLPPIVEAVLGTPFIDLRVRQKRRLPDGEVREFDAIVVTADSLCLNSTKASLRSADVERFLEEIDAFRRFFPEHDSLPLVGILATLAVEQSVLGDAEKLGFLVLAVGDTLMDIQNRPGFEPKRWPAPATGA
jgi:hypothetical protein